MKTYQHGNPASGKPVLRHYARCHRQLPDPACRQGGPNAAQYPDGCPGQTLRIALRAAQRVLGVISVDNLISGRPVTPAHAPPLVVFANALATALDNVTASERHTRVINNLDVDL